jgi:hypothetical protein
MGPLSYMRSGIDRNVTRRISVVTEISTAVGVSMFRFQAVYSFWIPPGMWAWMHKLRYSKCAIIRNHTVWNLEIWGPVKAAQWPGHDTITLQLGISLYMKQNLVVYILNDVASYCIHNVSLLTVHSMWDQNSAPIMILLGERRGPQHPDVARNVDFASCSC